MRRMTYISSVTAKSGEPDVDAILQTSRRNNAAAGVTGLLLFDGRRFLQALEGEAAQIDATYQRIKADPRHRAVVLLSDRDVESRAFGNWAMAAHRVTTSGGAGIEDQIDALTAGVEDANVRETFRSFARVRAAA